MQGDTRICSALRRDGSPCRAPALPGRSACFAHDETRQAALRESRRKGGREKARSRRLNRLVPASLRPTLDLLLDAIHEVHDGKLTAAQGTAMAALASAAVRVYTGATLEERVQAIEEAQQQLARQAG